MSECDVCIGGGYDCDDSETFYFNHRVTVKPQICDECGRKIPGGTLHEYARWTQDGEHVSARSCEVCAEIAWAFMCDQRCYFVLWERMDEVYGDLNTTCFNKLKTPEAKAELRRRWMKAKGLAPETK